MSTLHESLIVGDQPRPKDRRRCIKVVAVIASLVAIIFIALFIWKATSKPHGPRPHPGPGPNEPISPATADWIIGAMDLTADPCEDFVQYTCGAWQAQNQIAADSTKARTRSFSKIAEISDAEMLSVLSDTLAPAGQYYEGCINGAINATTDPTGATATRALTSLSRWLSLIDTNLNTAKPNASDIWYLFGLLHGHGLADGALLIQAQPKHKYDGRYGPVLPDTARIETQHEKVWAWEVRTSRSGGAFDDITQSNLSSIIALVQPDLKAAGLPLLYDAALTSDDAAEAIFAWDSLLEANLGDPNLTLANFTALKAQGFASEEYLRGLGDHSLVYTFAGRDTEGIDRTGYADHFVNIGIMKDYSQYLFTLINDLTTSCSATPAGTACGQLDAFAMNIKAHVVVDHLFILSQKYSAALPAERAAMYIDRSIGCKYAMQSDMRNVFENQLFVEYFHPDVTRQINDLVDRIYDELGRTLIATPWLTQATRTLALNKQLLMVKNVMYDSSWGNPRFGLVTTGDYTLDFVAGHSYNVQQLLASSDVPWDAHTPETEDDMTPYTMNAFYDPGLNSINMLPGLLKFPAFDASNPLMLNLATYGLIIGHEMTHGFDNNGRLYDSIGEERDWWTAADTAEFEERSQCFIDQYSSFKLYNQSIDGKHTLGENIADNGGMGLAWRSYKNLAKDAATNITRQLLPQLTNDQLFFVYTGQLWCQTNSPATIANEIIHDVHSPGQIRIFAPSQNRPEFAEAFNCPADSFMGRGLRKDKCQIW